MDHHHHLHDSLQGMDAMNHHGHASMEDPSSSFLSRPLCNADDDMGMIMYMDGFRWTLRGDGSCLNLLFSSWTLDTVPKFFLAMAAVFAAGVLTEGMRRWKHDLTRQQLQQQQEEEGTFGGNGGGRTTSRKQFVALQQTALQGLGLLSAYVLMLVVMTYSYELLGCVVGGLMAGYYWFDNEVFHHGGGTPCCRGGGGGSFAATTTTPRTTTTEAELAEPLLSRTTTAAPSSLDEHGVENSCCHNDPSGEDGI